MRILIFLTPTNKRGTKQAYTRLRKFLFSDGYVLIGIEQYMRVVQSRKNVDKYLQKLHAYNPGTGVIRILVLTEKQYRGIIYLTGEPDQQEKTVGSNYYILL